jgi:hypothetical protein
MTVFRKPVTRITKVVCSVLNDNTKLILIVTCNKWLLFTLKNRAFNFQPLFRRAHTHWHSNEWATSNDERAYTKRRPIFLRYNFMNILYIEV